MSSSNQPMRWDTREPCATCPYRMDAPIGLWDRFEFENLLKQDRDPLKMGAVFACHGTRKRPEGWSVCAGWLLDQKRRDVPSIQLRLVLLIKPEARVALDEVTHGGHKLFRTLRAMCRANGVK